MANCETIEDLLNRLIQKQMDCCLDNKDFVRKAEFNREVKRLDSKIDDFRRFVDNAIAELARKIGEVLDFINGIEARLLKFAAQQLAIFYDKILALINDNDSRLSNLEIRVGGLENAFQRINNAILALQGKVARLEQEVKRIEALIQTEKERNDRQDIAILAIPAAIAAAILLALKPVWTAIQTALKTLEGIKKGIEAIAAALRKLEEAVRKLQLQRGLKGDKGNAGKDGTNGKNGKDGKDGKEGKEGKKGDAGKDGKDGTNGKDGSSGRNGKDGKEGKKGDAGKDGKDGKEGKKGDAGKDGKDGKEQEVKVVQTVKVVEKLIYKPEYKITEKIKEVEKRVDVPKNPEFEVITVKKFDKCNPDSGGLPLFVNVKISVPKGTGAANIQLYETIARVEAQKCEQNSVAAIPEWWAMRVGADRPQLVILLAEDLGGGKFGRSRYPVSIPHYKGSQGTKPSIPRYQKGQYEAKLTLKDNSKLVVNAISETEGIRIIEALKIYIKPEYLQGASLNITHRKGDPLKQIYVVARTAKFFATGQKDTNPDWVINF
jgi:hypothetical protein